MFKIVNVGNENIEGCCYFDYKGYMISISTIFKPNNVAILKNGEFVVTDIINVEEAIAYVDMLLFKDSISLKKELAVLNLVPKELTCYGCDKAHRCEYAFDAYNIYGDCLDNVRRKP